MSLRAEAVRAWMTSALNCLPSADSFRSATEKELKANPISFTPLLSCRLSAPGGTRSQVAASSAWYPWKRGLWSGPGRFHHHLWQFVEPVRLAWKHKIAETNKNATHGSTFSSPLLLRSNSRVFVRSPFKDTEMHSPDRSITRTTSERRLCATSWISCMLTEEIDGPNVHSRPSTNCRRRSSWACDERRQHCVMSSGVPYPLVNDVRSLNSWCPNVILYSESESVELSPLVSSTGCKAALGVLPQWKTVQEPCGGA